MNRGVCGPSHGCAEPSIDAQVRGGKAAGRRRLGRCVSSLVPWMSAVCMDMADGRCCSRIVGDGVHGGEQLSVLHEGGFKVERCGVQVRVCVYACGAVSRGHDMRYRIEDRDGLGEVVGVANNFMGMELYVADDGGCDTNAEKRMYSVCIVILGDVHVGQEPSALMCSVVMVVGCGVCSEWRVLECCPCRWVEIEDSQVVCGCVCVCIVGVVGKCHMVQAWVRRWQGVVKALQ